MPYYQSNTLKHALCSSSSPLRRGGGEVLERICSKLGGGLDKAIVPVDSSVVAIEGPYSHRAGELQDMVLRNIDCTNLSAEYSLIDSHFSIINDLKTVNNQETDLYFYHSDHLGSSSFITDADGIVSQHLQYLPYGELFAEQRDNTARYYTPYKFSGKEKDEETGYSYFGARYYMPELSIWSAVDPMADKYPGMSAYMYCAGNPVKITDPDGRDWYLEEATGKYQHFEGNGTHDGFKHIGGDNHFGIMLSPATASSIRETKFSDVSGSNYQPFESRVLNQGYKNSEGNFWRDHNKKLSLTQNTIVPKPLALEINIQYTQKILPGFAITGGISYMQADDGGDFFGNIGVATGNITSGASLNLNMFKQSSNKGIKLNNYTGWQENTFGNISNVGYTHERNISDIYNPFHTGDIYQGNGLSISSGNPFQASAGRSYTYSFKLKNIFK